MKPRGDKIDYGLIPDKGVEIYVDPPDDLVVDEGLGRFGEKNPLLSDELEDGFLDEGFIGFIGIRGV